MKHRIKHRKLNRLVRERKALMKGLAIRLIEKGRVRTTVARAKELRKFVEPLVTRAKVDTVANRRLVASRLPHKPSVRKLFEDYGAKRFSDRPGGYLRVIKISGFRTGDAARMAEVRWSDRRPGASSRG
ncbi:MAG: 50S ribosomal protein L17 [Candidatus Hydrogenedentota bacterium]|nr:MAG: 50S ribosomal protein L17 [Candidatus Hydrogenedentota bacterium]